MSRIGRGTIVAVLAIALTPAGTSVAVTTTSPVGATTTTLVKPKPKPKPAPAPAPAPIKPAKGQLNLSLAGVFHVNNQPVTITARGVRVNGVVRPFVPGQFVVVHAFSGPKLVHDERVRVVRSAGGTYGHFSVRFSTGRTGSIFISAVHAADPKLARLVAYSGFDVLAPSAGFGSTGRFVQLIQSRLSILHFYLWETGVYDNGTGLAIDAYHRLRGWGTYQTLDRATINGLLDEVGTFRVRYPHDGKHAEGNLGNQLLALVNGKDVYRIYPVSSGKPSTPTVLGHFSVYDKRPGYLPDGMFFSSFFTGGYAIHGYDPAPDYPASHGCMRVPIPDAVSIYNWLDMGNSVDVYY
jgi:hypothetical protein